MEEGKEGGKEGKKPLLETSGLYSSQPTKITWETAGVLLSSANLSDTQ